MLELIQISVYRDGGTIQCVDKATDKLYYIDGRIGSHTRGQLFDHYPANPTAQNLKHISFTLKQKDGTNS